MFWLGLGVGFALGVIVMVLLKEWGEHQAFKDFWG